MVRLDCNRSEAVSRAHRWGILVRMYTDPQGPPPFSAHWGRPGPGNADRGNHQCDSRVAVIVGVPSRRRSGRDSPTGLSRYIRRNALILTAGRDDYVLNT